MSRAERCLLPHLLHLRLLALDVIEGLPKPRQAKPGSLKAFEDALAHQVKQKLELAAVRLLIAHSCHKSHDRLQQKIEHKKYIDMYIYI